MERPKVRERELQLMAKNVLLLKDTMKKWYNYTGIKFLQQHKLTDEQEAFLEEITEFVNASIDRLESDESFLKKILLPPIKLPQKKVKVK